MINKIQKRVELKYLVPKDTTLNFLNCLKKQNVLSRDQYADPELGRYTIESLYYDTPLDECLTDSVEGYPVRKKVRIRHYRDSNYKVISKDSLEIKLKSNQFSRKIRSPWTDGFKECITNLPLVNFDVCGPLLSKVVIEYERYPFLLLGEDNTRITLDVNIRSKLPTDFSKNFRGTTFLHDDFAVLEVKGSTPQTIRDFHDFLSKHIPVQSTRFSKYCLGVFTIQSTDHIDYWSSFRNYLKMDCYT